MPHPDVSIAGAGVIGLSLALELHSRGLSVVVLDRADPLAEASAAAAGMLAVDDPDNPPQLLALAQRSRSLYPAFLDRLHTLSSHRVASQTRTTLQSIPAHATHLSSLTPAQLHRHLPSLASNPFHFTLLDEHSLDPRDLAAALLAAVRATTIDLRSHTPVLRVHTDTHSVELATPTGTVHAGRFVDCTGAWSLSSALLPQLPLAPRKGQMLSVRIPPSMLFNTVLRTPDIYILPRTAGPHAGRAVIGATVEDAGFDKTIHPAVIAGLHTRAATLLPPLAGANVLESWSGLRPSTPDALPLLGPLASPANATTPPVRFIASGHFRNGILLAPATAEALADLLTGHPPAVDLSPFSPQRPPPVPLA